MPAFLLVHNILFLTDRIKIFFIVKIKIMNKRTKSMVVLTQLEMEAKYHTFACIKSNTRSSLTDFFVTQREKIVVDTVLITASGNVDQKAISHATGIHLIITHECSDSNCN